jgi:hypothetical protein
MGTPAEPLNFAALDRRIQAVPEGPVAQLGAPRWQRRLDAVGYVGIVVGLTPSLLVELMTPAWWMVWIAQAGLAMTACFIPGFARSAFLVLHGMRRWRPELVEQLDHDMAAMQTLQMWLARQPRDAVEAHLWFARGAQARLTQKMGFLFGGVDKVGVALVLGALGVQLKALTDGPVPWWAALISIFAVVLSALGVMTGLMRLRLQLYEAVLDDTLRRRGETKVTEAVKSS